MWELGRGKLVCPEISTGQAKNKFEKKLAKEAKKKPKMFYSYLRSKTANRSSVGPLKDEAVVSDDTGMANVLNKFFTSVFTTENPVLPEQAQYNVPEMLVDVVFSEDSVSQKIHALKTASAYGSDKIGPRVLKEAADVLCAPLSIVFSKSLELFQMIGRKQTSLLYLSQDPERVQATIAQYL